MNSKYARLFFIYFSIFFHLLFFFFIIIFTKDVTKITHQLLDDNRYVKVKKQRNKN